MSFVTRKVFDCKMMPDQTKQAFLNHSYFHHLDYHCYVEWWVTDLDNDIISKWLIDNGAAVKEYVIIHHWW